MKYGLALFSFILFFSSAQPINAQTNLLLTKASFKKVPPQIQLYARVIPQRIYKISSNLNGQISSFSINEGQPVDKTSPIANITSSAITTKMQSLHEKILQDKKELSATQSILKIVQEEYRQRLATQQTLLQARMKAEKAKTNLKIVQIQLRSLQAQTQVHSPVNGKILNVFTANGDYVKSGQTLVTILPNKNRLFARAYGEEGRQIRISQEGWFQSQDSTLPFLVVVDTIIPDPNVPGTWRIYLHPVNVNFHWFTGEVGTLKLINKPYSLIAVPKKALIMDQGKWWIIKKTDRGFQRVQVYPLISNKKWTWLKRGLNTGEEIVVYGAYQMFHKDFSKNYANPD